jgi:hypothetical protein
MHKLTAPAECEASSATLAPACSSISMPGWIWAGSWAVASSSAW